MSNQTLSEAETTEIRDQMAELDLEHRDLDQVINHLITHPVPDELLLRRLKKRKLGLKDRIMLLEALLVPDIPA